MYLSSAEPRVLVGSPSADIEIPSLTYTLALVECPPIVLLPPNTVVRWGKGNR